jgi:15-cis-phytoene synthase
LLRALRDDCGPRSIQTSEELIQFAYGVAGTVGQMLRYVIDAKNPGADAFAVDLGIALQLSNIMRDVAEDAIRGRFYLPAEWATPTTVQEAIDGHEDAIREVMAAIARTHSLAEGYYMSATKGMAYIPARNRRVIFFASALYREIGNKVLRVGLKSLSKRTMVTFPEKIRVGWCSIHGYWHWKKSRWKSDPKPIHGLSDA